jgi:hypothetical protein
MKARTSSFFNQIGYNIQKKLKRIATFRTTFERLQNNSYDSITPYPLYKVQKTEILTDFKGHLETNSNRFCYYQQTDLSVSNNHTTFEWLCNIKCLPRFLEFFIHGYQCESSTILFRLMSYHMKDMFNIQRLVEGTTRLQRS